MWYSNEIKFENLNQMLSLHLVKTLISHIVRGSYIRIIGIFELNLISVI